jgi:2-polyprenyl-6-hydroxyphenyl methylase/3-demethylubiquinone-9 3-methyltransferase
MNNEVATGSTVDQSEVEFFAAISESWWDPKGPFKPLHQLNPTRLKFIRDAVTEHFNLDTSANQPFKNYTFLDIGCGGGLISEPMSRLGADMHGVDASEKNIHVASHHAKETGATVNYRHATAEALAEAGETFDVIINMEVIEHVANVDAYLKACHSLLKPGGIMLLSTINRTAKAFLFAIVGAEYVLRWLPKGAHDWNKFITPEELQTACGKAGFNTSTATGFVFSPFSQKWSLSGRDIDVNYAMKATN